MDITRRQLSGKTRTEHDLLGNKEIPVEFYFGVQTMRAIENFNISRVRLYFFPELIKALAMVKEAAAMANRDLGLIDGQVAQAIIEACEEVRAGKLDDHFVVDMVQGGAGTSTNMNANEVIANRALEILGHQRGEYKYCHPNNDVNMSQSTNDAYCCKDRFDQQHLETGIVVEMARRGIPHQRCRVRSHHQNGTYPIAGCSPHDPRTRV